MCRIVLTDVLRIQVLIKKITYFIVELSYFTVFFCNLLRGFCLFRPPKTMAERCLRAVKSQLECVRRSFTNNAEP
jgi:hypothetical protein